LYALWDGLLGKRFGSTSTNRIAAEIASEAAMASRGKAAIENVKGLDVQNWLAESREAAKAHVYTPEIIQAVTAAARIGASAPELIVLDEVYLRNAGRVAQVRAAEAAYRLAAYWEQGLVARQ
jgi:hypothetical protein